VVRGSPLRSKEATSGHFAGGLFGDAVADPTGVTAVQMRNTIVFPRPRAEVPTAFPHVDRSDGRAVLRGA